MLHNYISLGAATIKTGTNDTWFIVKYITITIVFLLFLYFLSRYLVGKRNVRSIGKTSLKLIDLISVTPEDIIYIAEYNEKRYIIAANKGGISKIDEFKVDKTLIENEEQTAQQRPGFSDLLEKIRQRR